MTVADDGMALAQAAARLGEGAALARDWVREVRAKVQRIENAAPALVEATRDAESLARRIVRAAGRRTAVGVFGPSQAGKSYLVSALARRPGGRLEADFAGRRLDFLAEINPIGGGKEATGLVTRFTTARHAVDAERPVALRLLSETDLVRIFANSFFSDFDQNTRTLGLLDADRMRAVLDGLEGRAAVAGHGHLDEIALHDLGAYFRTRFRAQIEPLDRVGFWAALIRLGGRLALADRVTLYGLLWGGEPAFTRLFRRLLEGLASLGFAEQARAGLDTLQPTQTSIIDVDRLTDLATGAVDPRPPLVAPVGGDGPVALDRALLSALVAELTIHLPAAPWPFMERVDLLDFPGARSREKNAAVPTEPEAADRLLGRLFLRGKVAYLFQRFAEEREMAAMLLCMPQHKQVDVTDLGAMVDDWVTSTHGSTPEQRRRVPNTLFLMLTIHDFNFQRQAVDGDQARREWWAGRFKITAREHYGRFGWLDDWDGQPFRNCLFLRNPNHPQEHLVTYGPDRREIGLAPAAIERIASLRRAFEEDAAVVRHFADPAAVWDGALALDDGGVGLLVARLAAVLDPALARLQMGERLTHAAEELARRFRGYWFEEGEGARTAAEAKLREVRLGFGRAMLRRDRPGLLGHMLDGLSLTEAEARGVWENVAGLRGDPAAEPVADADDSEADDPWAEPAHGKSAVRQSEPVDRASVFARDVMQAWARKTRHAAADGPWLAFLGLAQPTLEAVAGEIETAAVRLDLRGRIAAEVRRQILAANVRWDDPPVVDRAARIATLAIGDHVAFLGLADRDDRPNYPEPPQQPERPIFAPAPTFAEDGLPMLGPQPEALARRQLLDWGIAFMRAGLDNLSRPDARDIAEADNRRLGEIVRRIAAVGRGPR